MIHLDMPTKLKWKAGQHYFLRFCTGDRHFFSSHPFTVASTPEDGRLEFLIKPRQGMTKALSDKVGSVRVLLDGPYGGPAADLACFEGVLLVAGGSGQYAVTSRGACSYQVSHSSLAFSNISPRVPAQSRCSAGTSRWSIPADLRVGLQLQLRGHWLM